MATRGLVAIQKKGRIRHSASHWRPLIGAFERSGETRCAFCARHGLSVSTFDAWRKRLGVVGEGSEALPVPPRFLLSCRIRPGGRLGRRPRRRGTLSSRLAVVWCCGFAGARHAERRCGAADLVVYGADRYALLVRRAFGAGEAAARRGSTQRAMIRVFEPPQHADQGARVRGRWLLDLEQAARTRAVCTTARSGRDSEASGVRDGVSRAARGHGC